ncbi:ClpP/crotonase-like domain-containing protein [Mycena haematopus]|nr:ClpP/crotonase-like domain-containing protein [Mycena haematopus]
MPFLNNILAQIPLQVADAAKIMTGSLNGAANWQGLPARNECPRAVSIPSDCSHHGLVLGLGIDILSGCYMRYAAEGSQFSIKEVDIISLVADVAMLGYLPKTTGNNSLMREMAYSTWVFSVVDTERMGLVSRVVSGGRTDVVAAALNLAGVIAGKSPVAVSGTKRDFGTALDEHDPIAMMA